MKIITGKTRLLGVMGDPVSHSKSPEMHAAALEEAGLDVAYVPLPVKAERLEEAVRGLRALGFVGCNVTLPHKEGVAKLMDELTPEARLAGTVNTIRIEENGRLFGHNTDVVGAVNALTGQGANFQGAEVLILGAGGAARGSAIGAALAGASRITFLNRNLDRARRLAAEFKELNEIAHCEFQVVESPAVIDFEKVGIVLQMTSLGMREDDPMPLSPEVLTSDTFILEAVYSPPVTKFLNKSLSLGLPSVDGFHMLIEQGAASFEFWFGKSPSRERMAQVLRPQ